MIKAGPFKSETRVPLKHLAKTFSISRTFSLGQYSIVVLHDWSCALSPSRHIWWCIAFSVYTCIQNFAKFYPSERDRYIIVYGFCLVRFNVPHHDILVS